MQIQRNLCEPINCGENLTIMKHQLHDHIVFHSIFLKASIWSYGHNYFLLIHFGNNALFDLWLSPFAMLLASPLMSVFGLGVIIRVPGLELFRLGNSLSAFETIPLPAFDTIPLVIVALLVCLFSIKSFQPLLGSAVTTIWVSTLKFFLCCLAMAFWLKIR